MMNLSYIASPAAPFWLLDFVDLKPALSIGSYWFSLETANPPREQALERHQTVLTAHVGFMLK